jgi:ABC-type lipoprotein release transport system permease subunit
MQKAKYPLGKNVLSVFFGIVLAASFFGIANAIVNLYLMNQFSKEMTKTTA